VTRQGRIGQYRLGWQLAPSGTDVSSECSRSGPRLSAGPTESGLHGSTPPIGSSGRPSRLSAACLARSQGHSRRIKLDGRQTSSSGRLSWPGEDIHSLVTRQGRIGHGSSPRRGPMCPASSVAAASARPAGSGLDGSPPSHDGSVGRPWPAGNAAWLPLLEAMGAQPARGAHSSPGFITAHVADKWKKLRLTLLAGSGGPNNYMQVCQQALQNSIKVNLCDCTAWCSEADPMIGTRKRQQLSIQAGPRDASNLAIGLLTPVPS
jgi:hypothetical protein